MSEPVRFVQLSPARRALIRLCQVTNYGSIERLHISDSEPVMGPPPLILQDLKLDCDQELRPELDLPDFELKDEFCRLMRRIDGLKNGTIERIEVRAGIPRRLLVGAPALSSEFAAR